VREVRESRAAVNGDTVIDLMPPSAHHPAIALTEGSGVARCDRHQPRGRGGLFGAARAIGLLLLISFCNAHSAEEIEARGREIMEEYRQDQGHWVDAHDIRVVEHTVDHVGADGLAVAAFFLHPSRYASATPNTAEQDADAGFAAYRKVAREQARWIGETGVDGGKTWTFAYGHDKAVAELAGCELGGADVHACLLMWRSSKDGSEMQSGQRIWRAAPPTSAQIEQEIIQHTARHTGGVEAKQGRLRGI